MSYYKQEELEKMGFKFIGKNVKLSDKTSIYNHENIEIGDNSRIDDFCVISGKIKIGRNVYIAPFCLLAGGENGIIIDDFAGLSYKVQVFTQTDDYSGATMTNSTIPLKYKKEIKTTVFIGRHSAIGAGVIIMLGVKIGEGSAIGAMSLVRKSTEEWTTYLGNPAKKIKRRKKDLLKLEKEYLKENN